MAYKLYDFYCPDCDEVWEDLVDEPKCVHTCGKECTPTLSVPNLGTFSMMSPEQKKAHLQKRSQEHTQKQIIDKQPEKWGAEGVKRATKRRYVRGA